MAAGGAPGFPESLDRQAPLLEFIRGGGDPNTVVPAVGADGEPRLYAGMPLLTYAVTHNMANLANALFERGVNLEAEGTLGVTPLQEAILQGVDYRIIRLLLQRGANPTNGGTSGSSPLDYAETQLQEAREAENADAIRNYERIIKTLLQQPGVEETRYPEWPAEGVAVPEIELPAPAAGEPFNQNAPGRAISTLSLEAIRPGTRMVNFHGEREHGRFYTLEDFQGLVETRRRKKNPVSRGVINPENVSFYVARGGRGSRRRRATRKARKHWRSSRK